MAQNQDKSNLRKQIDENLRRVYQESVEEEVPDRFVDLLKRLKEKQGGGHGEKA